VQVPETTPYQWPYDGRLDLERFALVVTGVQYGLRDLIGEDACAEPLCRIAMVAGTVRAARGTVVWVRHGGRSPRRRPLLPITGTRAWSLCVGVAESDVVVDAAGWDGCFASSLDHDLRTRRATYLALAGLASELTVDSFRKSRRSRVRS
jgi:nicotinamidase-related amidase